MTESEKQAFAALAKAWDMFVCLPVEHHDDIAEFRHGIHILQRQILARPARREMNRKD